MKKKGEGRIINIVDASVFNPQRRYIPYASAKGGLLTMTRGLAKELAPEVLVNAVCPGPIIPPSGMTEKGQEAIRKKTLLRRWGTPADVAKLVLFLAEQDYATGGYYLVDGGQSLV
jgi:NAD(P)-dependent dehydrogenase (short-subunit alcohol dehydrogenase family)